MAGEEIRVGPFVGGLNSLSDPTSIGDTELADIVNFELDEDGSMVNRPPMVAFVALPAGKPTRILGYYSLPGGVRYLIATDSQANTYYFNGSTWTLIAAIAATAIAQYRDELWIIVGPNETTVGGKWTPTAGFVADPNIPRGQAIVSHKDRLWIVPGKSARTNGSRMYLSNIVSATVSWPASPNVLNIGAGDGQNIVDMIVYGTDLVIFKERSTYRFSFTGDPSLGTISRTSATIGASDYGCVAEWQNQLFVLFGTKVFEFSNYIYTEINIKVPLSATNPSATLTRVSNMSAWSDRLIVNYYNETYVYHINFRVWTKWETKIPGMEFLGNIVQDLNSPSSAPTALITCATQDTSMIYRMFDEIRADSAEEMDCFFVTKNYDYDSATRWKRLFMVAVDVIANVMVTVTVRPVVFTRTATWGQMKAMHLTWGEWKALRRTWGSPIDVSLDQSEDIPVQGSPFGRKSVKFLPRSLRFRQIAYKIGGKTSGNTATAPLRVFGLTTFVKDKEYVSPKVS